jgi:hypothetical protein
MDRTRKQTQPVSVVVLHNEGCPSTTRTIELIEACVAEAGMKMNFRKILVKTHEEANNLRFLGSPTIQVNGMDIDPSARDTSIFGFM